MALLAAERRDDWRVRLGALLAPTPGRLAFAARLAFLCAVTTLVTEIYQTPDAALTAYVVFFLNKPDRMSSIIMPVALTIVLTVLIGLVFLLAQFVLDDPGLRVLAMALVSFGFLFLVSASKLRPVGQIFALIVAYALDLLGSIPAGELATRGLLYAWLFVGIPAGVSIVFNLLLAKSPRRLAQDALARRLRLAARFLRAPGAPPELAEALRQGNGEIAEWLGRATAEKTAPAEDIAALRQAGRASIALLLALDFIARTPAAVLPAPLAQALARTLEEMAAILEQGGYPLRVTVPPPQAMSPLAWAAYDEIADCMERFAEKPDAAPPVAKQSGGFFLPDAFTDPRHVQYALKTTAAAMICYLTYSLLDWPGIHTCLITCYIVSLSTVAESVEKLALRIAGCLVGAAFGLLVLIFLVPAYDSITALLVTVFLGAFAAAWVAAGSPRIAYVGFQIAFAFFLCVIQGSGPAFDMVVARDRVIGILFGNVVVYLISTQVWPVSLKTHIQSGVASLLQRLSALGQARDHASRRAAAVQALAAQAAVEDDLDVVRYEPLEIRPSPDWLSLRRELLDCTAALRAPLFLAADQGGRAALEDAVAARTRDLNRVLANMGEAAYGTP